MEVLQRRVFAYIVTKHAIRPDVAWPIPRQRASFGAVVAGNSSLELLGNLRLAIDRKGFTSKITLATAASALVSAQEFATCSHVLLD